MRDYETVGFVQTTAGTTPSILIPKRTPRLRFAESTADEITSTKDVIDPQDLEPSGVVFDGPMVKLEDLLRRKQVAMAVIERRTMRRGFTRERRAWTALTALAVVWGFFTGLSFIGEIWLHPVTGLSGCLGIGVLAATILAHGRRG